MKLKTLSIYISALFIVTLVLTATIFYIYSQEYVQDSKDSATKGLIFKKTLNLEHYKNVSSGNGMLGKYDRYSRSLNHSDVITVYCKEFCKE